MAKQRHIGLIIFAACSALSARLAVFEPEPHVPTAAEIRWGATKKNGDTLGVLHGLRFYIYGIGVIGLLIVAEDYIGDRLRSKRPNQSLQRNAGSRPSSGDSSASGNPSSLGPRG